MGVLKAPPTPTSAGSEQQTPEESVQSTKTNPQHLLSSNIPAAKYTAAIMDAGPTPLRCFRECHPEEMFVDDGVETVTSVEQVSGD